jgi:hypothetical protein
MRIWASSRRCQGYPVLQQPWYFPVGSPCRYGASHHRDKPSARCFKLVCYVWCFDMMRSLQVQLAS